MEVKEIDTNILYVSNCNVRKTLEGDEDDTNISDLANDIRTNGLINPITVRKIDDKYEGIASDQKIKWFYVKKNPYNLNGIAYTGKYPTEFKLQVDIDTMFVKLMAQELERVYECI